MKFDNQNQCSQKDDEKKMSKLLANISYKA